MVQLQKKIITIDDTLNITVIGFTRVYFYFSIQIDVEIIHKRHMTYLDIVGPLLLFALCNVAALWSNF